jgi:exodeoxyribonuclease VII large subunit
MNLQSRLQTLSPLGVLQRGYALVQKENGDVVRSVTQVTTGQTILTLLSDGSLSSNVTTIKHRKKDKSTSK